MRQRLAGAVDIHSHILFGIDDGAVEVIDSLNMAKVSASEGTVVMAATPHRYYGGKENTPELIRKLARSVQTQIEGMNEKLDFRVILGQEIPLTLSTAQEICDGKVLTYGDARKYALVEPPFDRLPEWIPDAISKIKAIGVTPVFAHPERNSGIQADPSLARAIVEAGAETQLTAMSLTGDNGTRAFETAIWLLQEKLVSIVSSDCHSATWRPPFLRAAFDVVTQFTSEEVAMQLFVVNPGRVVS